MFQLSVEGSTEYQSIIVLYYEWQCQKQAVNMNLGLFKYHTILIVVHLCMFVLKLLLNNWFYKGNKMFNIYSVIH